MQKTQAKTKRHFEALGWQVVGTKLQFRCPWYEVREDMLVLPGKKRIAFTHVRHPGSVFVVPFTKDGKIILIRSYRYSIDRWCWEVPAGSLADAKGKRPRTVARSELAEEIGATTSKLVLIGTQFMCNGVGSFPGWFFVAEDVRINQCRSLGPMEVIKEVVKMPEQTVRSLILKGDFGDGDSALAILLALEHRRNRGRSKPRK